MFDFPSQSNFKEIAKAILAQKEKDILVIKRELVELINKIIATSSSKQTALESKGDEKKSLTSNPAQKESLLKDLKKEARLLLQERFKEKLEVFADFFTQERPLVLTSNVKNVVLRKRIEEFFRNLEDLVSRDLTGIISEYLGLPKWLDIQESSDFLIIRGEPLPDADFFTTFFGPNIPFKLVQAPAPIYRHLMQDNSCWPPDSISHADEKGEDVRVFTADYSAPAKEDTSKAKGKKAASKKEDTGKETNKEDIGKATRLFQNAAAHVMHPIRCLFYAAYPDEVKSLYSYNISEATYDKIQHPDRPIFFVADASSSPGRQRLVFVDQKTREEFKANLFAACVKIRDIIQKKIKANCFGDPSEPNAWSELAFTDIKWFYLTHILPYFVQKVQKARDEVLKAQDEALRAQDEAQKAQDEAQKAQDEVQKAQEKAQKAQDEAQKAKEKAQKALAKEPNLMEELQNMQTWQSLETDVLEKLVAEEFKPELCLCVPTKAFLEATQLTTTEAKSHSESKRPEVTPKSEPKRPKVARKIAQPLFMLEESGIVHQGPLAGGALFNFRGRIPLPWNPRFKVAMGIDTSGSMGSSLPRSKETRIDVAKKAAPRFLQSVINELTPEQRALAIISVGRFDSTGQWLGTASAADNKACRELYKTISDQERLGSGTTLMELITQWLEKFIKSGNDLHQLLILTDGEIFDRDRVLPLISRANIIGALTVLLDRASKRQDKAAVTKIQAMLEDEVLINQVLQGDQWLPDLLKDQLEQFGPGKALMKERLSGNPATLQVSACGIGDEIKIDTLKKLRNRGRPQVSQAQLIRHDEIWDLVRRLEQLNSITKLRVPCELRKKVTFRDNYSYEFPLLVSYDVDFNEPFYVPPALIKAHGYPTQIQAVDEAGNPAGKFDTIGNFFEAKAEVLQRLETQLLDKMLRQQHINPHNRFSLESPRVKQRLQDLLTPLTKMDLTGMVTELQRRIICESLSQENRAILPMWDAENSTPRLEIKEDEEQKAASGKTSSAASSEPTIQDQKTAAAQAPKRRYVRRGEKGPQVKAENASGDGPLHEAVRNRDLQYLIELIDNGDEINARNADGLTPLALAASLDELECVKLLLEAKAEHWAKDNQDNGINHLIMVNGAIKVAKYVEAYVESKRAHTHFFKSSRNHAQETPLHSAIRCAIQKQDLSSLEFFVEEKIIHRLIASNYAIGKASQEYHSYDTYKGAYYSILHYVMRNVVEEGSAPYVVKVLDILFANMTLEPWNIASNGRTPLHDAIEYQPLAVVSALCRHLKEAKDAKIGKAVFTAEHFQKTLKERSEARVTGRGASGNKAPFRWCEPSTLVLKRLIASNPKEQEELVAELWPLMPELKTLKLPLTGKNCVLKESLPIVEHVIANDCVEAARYLAAQNRLAIKNDEKPILYLAAELGATQVVGYMLTEEKHDPNVVCKVAPIGHTPLSTALQHNHKETVSCLMKFGADPWQKVARTETPLSVAIQESELSTLEHFITELKNPELKGAHAYSDQKFLEVHTQEAKTDQEKTLIHNRLYALVRARLLREQPEQQKIIVSLLSPMIPLVGELPRPQPCVPPKPKQVSLGAQEVSIYAEPGDPGSLLAVKTGDIELSKFFLECEKPEALGPHFKVAVKQETSVQLLELLTTYCRAAQGILSGLLPGYLDAALEFAVKENAIPAVICLLKLGARPFMVNNYNTLFHTVIGQASLETIAAFLQALPPKSQSIWEEVRKTCVDPMTVVLPRLNKETLEGQQQLCGLLAGYIPECRKLALPVVLSKLQGSFDAEQVVKGFLQHLESPPPIPQDADVTAARVSELGDDDVVWHSEDPEDADSSVVFVADQSQSAPEIQAGAGDAKSSADPEGAGSPVVFVADPSQSAPKTQAGAGDAKSSAPSGAGGPASFLPPPKTVPMVHAAAEAKAQPETKLSAEDEALAKAIAEIERLNRENAADPRFVSMRINS